MGATVPKNGYVRCEVLLPMLGCRIVPIPETPTRRELGLLTDDGSLAIDIDAESAQALSELLAKAIIEMREEEESERQAKTGRASVRG